MSTNNHYAWVPTANVNEMPNATTVSGNHLYDTADEGVPAVYDTTGDGISPQPKSAYTNQIAIQKHTARQIVTLLHCGNHKSCTAIEPKEVRVYLPS
jgi:hypothetical protein